MKISFSGLTMIFRSDKKGLTKIFTKGLTIYKTAYILIRQSRKTRCYGVIAQLGEHLPYKQGVTGSSPVGPISHDGGIAQLARAHGSYPWCREFESPRRYQKYYSRFFEFDK